MLKKDAFTKNLSEKKRLFGRLSFSLFRFLIQEASSKVG